MSSTTVIEAVKWAQLHCHPSVACPSVTHVSVVLQRHAGVSLRLSYRISGEQLAIRVPALSPATRRDELWKHTCAELFVIALDDEPYCEFNFSPSQEWAAYEFSSYRRGMQPANCAAPKLHVEQTAQLLSLDIDVELPKKWQAVRPWQLGLSLVLEDDTGRCSHWALRHDADRPDFHQRDSMTLIL